MNSRPTSTMLLTIDASVRHWAQQCPHAIAVMNSEGDALDYAALHEFITSTRGQLRNLGIGQNDRVSLLFAPGPVATTAFISVASNAISAPLNYLYKRTELESALKALRPRVLMIGADLDTPGRDVAAELRIPVIEIAPSGSAGQFELSLDRYNANAAATPPLTDSNSTASPDDIALMLHTSGSTGRPKCVPLSHQVICVGSHNTSKSLRLSRNDRCLNLLAPCHVHGLVSNTIVPLVSGGSIIAATGFQENRISEFLLERQPTWISAPPSMQQQIAETMAASDGVPVKTSLRFLRSGSVPLWPELIELLTGTFAVPVVEAYGMTEVPHISGNPTEQCRPGSVGKPVVDELAIMNSDGEILPDGSVGEIVVRGRNVTSGYVNAPEANDIAFRDGWFRTGDLGWLDADGYLFLKGRHQEIINRGGNKVMPREVEEALIQHPSVRRTVVFPVAHPNLGSDIAAAVVLVSGHVLDESNLRRFVGELISDFKVPTRIIEVADFPVEASGKINRTRLEDRLATILKIEFEPPTGAVEIRLSQIFQEVLRQDRIGRLDNFFALGGHSLLAARVIARVISQFKVDLPLRSLFESPTISELSTEIEKCRKAGARSGDVPLLPLDRANSDGLPLSFSQQRLWFLEQMEGELTAYNMPYRWKLSGTLNASAVEQALETIIHRHEPLRTTFELNDGEPVQVVGLPEPFRLVCEDLRTLNHEVRQTRIAELSREIAERPFDLTGDLMLRASLLQLADDEHLLLLTMHHIAFDGSSMRVLWRELATLYSSYCCGETPKLPELPVRYADYAIWQRSRLQGEKLSHLLSYWRGQLEDLRPLELLTDHPRPATPTHRAGRYDFCLNADLVEPLKELAQSEGATLHMTLLAAFQTLLARLSRQDDIAVATPVAGRSHAQLENQIGFFVNTLVLRTDLGGTPTFRELLARVREVSLAAYDHQELPFEKLVEELQPERHLSRSPLVQVLFQLMNFSDHALVLPGLETARLPDSSHRVVFDLELHLWQQPTDIRGSLVYSAELFDATTVERMAGQFVSLLSSIVATPDAPHYELSLITEFERHQLLTEWNATAVDYPSDKCVHEIFELHVERTPDATAVIFDSQKLTYLELNQRANQLASYLRKQGITTESMVGLCLERSTDLVVGILGILKAGGAYLPLDADYPTDRLQFILDDADLGFLVTQKSLLSRVPEGRYQVVCLDADQANFQQMDASNPSVEISASNLAYVMFTSGSTGRPKGVQIPHKAVVNFLCSMAREPGLSSDDRLLSVTRPTFDISVLELLLPLSVGASVNIVSAEVAADAMQLSDQLSTSNTTVVQATPATWQMLIDAGWNGSKELKVLCGGEDLTDGLAAKLFHRSGELWNMYGPTETTIWSTIHLVKDGNVRGEIGRPIANTQVHVLDAYGQLVPVGIAGELCIGGHGLARGYLNRPELTAEKFQANPFDEAPDTKLYRTGDLCRWRQDGSLEFLGRLDGQVKLRGYRIELGEIEAALNDHGDVAQCVVVLREDRPGEKRLVAYCVPSADSELIVSKLRSHICSKLPDYMVPTAIVTLGALPLTSSGKIDRRALPEPEHSQSILPVLTTSAPADLLERRLQQIWCKLFDDRSIGRDDNFFELGGHSLLAVRVVLEIEKLLGWRLPVATLFQTPTIASLAEVLRQKNGTAPTRASLVPLQPQGSRSPFFFVHGWGGEVFGFEHLAGRLAPHQPVFGLRAVDPFGAKDRHTSVEEMAAHYVREIRSFQPTGPYYVGGYSAGGWIAFEIAQQLTRQGQSVRMLGVLDTGPVSRLPKLLHWWFLAPHLARRLGLHARRLCRIPRRDVLHYLKGRWTALRGILSKTNCLPLAAPDAPTEATSIPAASRSADRYGLLVSQYRPQKYVGVVDLFAIDSTLHKVPPENLFKHYSRGGVRVHRVAGDHNSIIDEDHSQEFATIFQQAIDAA